MKAITVREPYASLIINGLKIYEFRSWNTKYRGKILIHAGKGKDKLSIKRFEKYNLDYGYGEIIGEAYIYDCVPVDENFKKELLKLNPDVYQKSVFDEKYACCLKDIKKYDKRIKCNGKLSLWNVDETIIKQIETE